MGEGSKAKGEKASQALLTLTLWVVQNCLKRKDCLKMMTMRRWGVKSGRNKMYSGIGGVGWRV